MYFLDRVLMRADVFHNLEQEYGIERVICDRQATSVAEYIRLRLIAAVGGRIVQANHGVRSVQVLGIAAVPAADIQNPAVAQLAQVSARTDVKAIGEPLRMQNRPTEPII